MCTKTTAHTKKHDSHPSSLWACVSAEDDWYYDCCTVGSVWGMFLWHKRPLSVLLHVSRLKGKGGWNPSKRLGVFVIRGLPGNLNTFTFLGSEEQWLVRLIWKQSFLWTPYNLKGNGCFFLFCFCFSFYPSEEYDKMSEGDDFALKMRLWLAGRKKPPPKTWTLTLW